MSRKKPLEDILDLSVLTQPELPPIPMAMPQEPQMPPVPMSVPTPKKKASAAQRPVLIEDAPEAPIRVAGDTVRDYIKQKYGLDDELKAAQSAADDDRMLASLGAAGNTIGAAIAGTKADNSAYDKMRSDAGQRVQDVKDRSKAQMDALQMESASTDLDAKKAMRDPNSKESQAFRKMLASNFPQIAKAYGKDFDSISVADRESIMDPLRLKEQIEGRKQSAALLAGQRRDTLDEKKRLDQEKKQSAMYEIEDRRQNIGAALDSLDKMVEEDGTWEAVGSHNQDMDRLVDQVATDMAKLQDPQGVARPAEVEMNKKNLIQSGFKNSNETARDIIRNFRSEVDRRADSAYKVRGLQKPAGGGSSFPMTVRRGTEVATVSSEAELKEAQAEGFR